MMNMQPTRVMILGATGSIGVTALTALSEHRNRFAIVGLSCHTHTEQVLKWADEFQVPNICVTGNSNCDISDGKKNFYAGTDGLRAMIMENECDVILNGISGSAGMVPSFWALEAGRDLALANKESVVMGGPLLFEAARASGSSIIPVDSEHSTIDALIAAHGKESISSVIITASGGPFRSFTTEQMKDVRPADALNHPTWSMGRKISIDSATLANKGLEVIEACYLFDINPEKVEVVIHPQSIVHSMVRLINGAVYAQMSPPDMSLPIMEAVNINRYPLRNVVRPLDFSLLDLSFSVWDERRFPMLAYAYRSIGDGGSYPIAFNRANEIAVNLFLENKIPFPAISEIVHQTLQGDYTHGPSQFEEILIIDRAISERIGEFVSRFIR